MKKDQVREIRASNLSQRKLGGLYGVSQVTIGRVCRNIVYKFIENDGEI